MNSNIYKYCLHHHIITIILLHFYYQLHEVSISLTFNDLLPYWNTSRKILVTIFNMDELYIVVINSTSLVDYAKWLLPFSRLNYVTKCKSLLFNFKRTKPSRENKQKQLSLLCLPWWETITKRGRHVVGLAYLHETFFN